MPSSFQLAAKKDVPRLLEMMHELYEHDGMKFNEDVARKGLNKLLLDPTLGSVYLIFVDEELAGYLLLTSCFSLEFHGKFALLDELFIREQFRRRSLGKSAVEFAENLCRKMDISALRLEVVKKNKAAQALYDSVEFNRDNRYLYTKWV